MLFNAGIDGEKKYSPPLGTTHSVARDNDADWLLGSVPTNERDVMFDPAWPMIGSNPGVTGALGGKPVLLAQPARVISPKNRKP